MNTLIAVLLFCFVFATEAAIPDVFLRAIHLTETGGRKGAVKGVNGELGPFQISYAYWVDAINYDRSIGGSFQSCAEYNYSVRIVRTYLRQNGQRFIDKLNLEALARIHNGGPLGYKNPQTKAYWRKVRGYLN